MLLSCGCNKNLMDHFFITTEKLKSNTNILTYKKVSFKERKKEQNDSKFHSNTLNLH